ncbi:MAG TPA: SLC13 family permease [Bacteroidetes bacterium]|nr:SLC13 family permease [Bacteroidota bacterium]
MITFDIVLVFIVLIFIVVSLYTGLLGPVFTFILGVVVLGFFRILTPGEMLSGFANEQVMIVILLLLIGEVIRKTAIAELVFDRYFRKARSYNGFMSRMVFMVSVFSAFLNNTPLVAVMMPYVRTWSKRYNISPSKLLIPLSYAAILGGSATLIGTSTNLIVNGMVTDQHIVSGLPSLGIFDFVWVGVPMIVLGGIYLLLVGKKLLPARKDSEESSSTGIRTYFIEVQIKNNSPLVGQTIEESGLRNLPGLYLVEIHRMGKRIFVVSNNLTLEKGDKLTFAGENKKISLLTKPEYGLSIPSAGMLQRKKHANLLEIVISPNSSMIGKPLRDVNFRARYNAAVIGIYRNEESIPPRIRETILQAGDVLMLYAGSDFSTLSRDSHDFYFVSKVKEIEKVEGYKIVILLSGLALIILLSALKLISLFMGLVVLLMVVLILKMTKAKDLARSIDYNLGLIIVMSLALGTAMIKTGAADLVAHYVIVLLIPLGKIAVLTGIYAITAVIAAYVTNKAAVAIMFPISLSISLQLHLPAMPFILVVAYASAANFMTPIGYQTNLMVYGPGAYKFKDYFRIGFPLTVIYMIVAVTVLSLKYF